MVSIVVAFQSYEFLSGKILSPKSNIDFPISTFLKGNFQNIPYFFEIYIYPTFLPFLTRPERAVAKARSAEPARVGLVKKGKKVGYM